MRNQFFVLALVTTSFLAACSKEDNQKESSSLFAGEGFSSEFGFGEETCDTLPEGQDSLVGQYQPIILGNAKKEAFPEIPFAYVADSTRSVPAISRAVLAMAADPLEAGVENSETRTLYLSPNVRNIIKLAANQIFIFGTEKRWMEVSPDFAKKTLSIVEYVKGQTRPVSSYYLTGNHEFISNALTGEATMATIEFINRQLFVIEKLDENTFSFELKYNGVESTYECQSYTSFGNLESVWGFGTSEATAKQNLQSTCENIQKLPGMEFLSCDTVQPSAVCQPRQNTEFLESDTVLKPVISASCLGNGLGDSGDFLVGKHIIQPSQTEWPNAIARANSNYDHFFVAKTSPANLKTVDQIADFVRKDFKTYELVNDPNKPEANTSDIRLLPNDTIYIGHTTSLPGVGQYLEIKGTGKSFIFSTYSYGSVVDKVEVMNGDARSGFQLLNGISQAISFNYSFEELEPFDGSAFHLVITPEKINFN